MCSLSHLKPERSNLLAIYVFVSVEINEKRMMTKFYPWKHPHTQLWNIKSGILIIETFVKPFKYSTSATTFLPLRSNPALPKSINLQQELTF